MVPLPGSKITVCTYFGKSAYSAAYSDPLSAPPNIKITFLP